MSLPRTTEYVSLTAMIALVTCTVLTGCDDKKAAFVPPPPPEVTIKQPEIARVPETMEFTGVTRGVETVEIRARVRGFLEKKLVQDGRRVKKGDLLFVIDPRSFEASVQEQRAEVASREADQRIAEITLQRTQEASQAGAASNQEIDRSQAQRDGAAAQVDLAKAMLAQAELDLEFTQIKSPIDGRIGFVEVDVGDLVGASDPTLLTHVINDSQIYAMYEMPERVVLELRRSKQNKRPGEDGRPNLEVHLGQSNDTAFPHKGWFERADNTVNPDTGTIKIEALFDNADGTILPGAFVRVQPQFGEREAMLIPDTAVLSDQRGRYVLVVDDTDTVQRRDVRVGKMVDRSRIVLEGLEVSERVIVNGLQRARAGMKVNIARATPTPEAKK
jgi:RND family efflux transporter MFP subunit